MIPQLLDTLFISSSVRSIEPILNRRLCVNDPETTLAESQTEVSYGTYSRKIEVVPNISY